MKKIFVLFSALTTLLCGMVFTSCDGLDDDFIAPKDQWVYKSSSSNEYSYTYTVSEGKTISFDVYVNYASSAGAEVEFKNDVKVPVEKGMNIILVPKAESESGLIKEALSLTDSAGIDTVAAFYSFGEKAQAGEGETGTEQNLTSTAWTFIYNLNRFDKTDATFTKLLKTYTSVTDLKNMNMKRVLSR